MGICADWAKEQQGKHLFQCGCNEVIVVKPRHHGARGIPDFKRGHHVKYGNPAAKWVAENQDRYICACGCGQFIKITKWHRESDFPKYIHGHAKGLPLSIWIRREQGCHRCGCGCNQAIPLRREHRRHGIPKFILGHNAKGAGNPAWLGGISTTYTTRRHAMVPESWRQAVYLRDGHLCVRCGSDKQPSHAHHVISFRKRPDLGNKLWNGITLCEVCHLSIKGREEDFEQEFFVLLSRG